MTSIRTLHKPIPRLAGSRLNRLPILLNMKYKPQMKYLPIYAAIVCAILSACSTLQPGNDPVVVRAEQTQTISKDTLDAFVTYERNNDSTLRALNPAIHTYANYVRAHGQQWLRTLQAEKLAYKNNRTAENKANLLTAVAVLQEAVKQIGIYMSQAQAGGH
jgi:hypothetical protein